jgi:hypothetical protein
MSLFETEQFIYFCNQLFVLTGRFLSVFLPRIVNREAVCIDLRLAHATYRHLTQTSCTIPRR